MPPPFRQLNKFDTAKATWHTDFNCSSNFNFNSDYISAQGEGEEGGVQKGGGGSAASISCIYFEAPKVFELPESEPHGLAYAKCRPSEKERDALPLLSMQSQMDVDVDMDMDMNVAKPRQTAMRTAVCVHA